MSGNSGSEHAIFQSEPTNYACDVPLVKIKDDGLKTSYEVPLLEESRSENEIEHFKSKQISKKENEGINRRHEKLASEQNKSENSKQLRE